MLIGSQALGIQDNCEIDPVRFYVEMGGSWYVLAPEPRMCKGKKAGRVDLVCTHALVLVNIFNEVG